MEQLFHISNVYGSVLLDRFHYVVVEPGWSIGNHRHLAFEFIFVAKGRLSQSINGIPCDIPSGSAIVIKPGIYHHSNPVEEETELFVFHFQLEDETVSSVFQSNTKPYLYVDPDTNGNVIQLWVKQFLSQFADDLKTLDSGLLPTTPLKERTRSSILMLQMQASVLNLISLLASFAMNQHNSSIELGISPSHLRLAHEAAYRLGQSSAVGLKIQDLANQLHVHRSHLSSCFREVYGMTIRDFMTNIRIRETKKLLLETDLSLESIAERLCYASPSHLSLAFQKYAGISPIKYRNRYKSLI
ncbi:AraC family transcriptional regulator [Paenibacillus marinisediminis]